MSKISFVALSVVLAISMPLLAADKSDTKSTESISIPVDGNVFFTDANGKHAIDPICGMTVTVDAKTPTADADGKHYYFCNAGCGKAFSADPAKAIDKLVLPAGVTAMSGGKMMANCAVSSERIAVTDKTPHQVYKGHDYFFCCNKCPVSFAKNPDKYVAAMTKAESKAKMDSKDKIEMKGDKEHKGHEGH